MRTHTILPPSSRSIYVPRPLNSARGLLHLPSSKEIMPAGGKEPTNVHTISASPQLTTYNALIRRWSNNTNLQGEAATKPPSSTSISLRTPLDNGKSTTPTSHVYPISSGPAPTTAKTPASPKTATLASDAPQDPKTVQSYLTAASNSGKPATPMAAPSPLATKPSPPSGTLPLPLRTGEARITARLVLDSACSPGSVGNFSLLPAFTPNGEGARVIQVHTANQSKGISCLPGTCSLVTIGQSGR